MSRSIGIHIFLMLLLLLAGCAGEPVKEEPEAPQGPELVKMFNHYYFEAPDQGPRVFGSTFLGVALVQNPADMWVMQELITAIRPDYIIETGTLFGGAALYFATVLREVNEEGRVITIDIAPRVDKAFEVLSATPELLEKVQALFDSHIEVITASSVDTTLVETLTDRVKGKRVIVTLDSCHNYEHVLRELELYSPLVPVGSYLIVQDTFLDDRPEWVSKYANCPGYAPNQGGPGRAVREFLKKNGSFAVDKTKEKFFLTSYPSGYLRRIK